MVYAVIQKQRPEMLKTICKKDECYHFYFFVVVVVTEGNNAGRREVFKIRPTSSCYSQKGELQNVRLSISNILLLQ